MFFVVPNAVLLEFLNIKWNWEVLAIGGVFIADSDYYGSGISFRSIFSIPKLDLYISPYTRIINYHDIDTSSDTWKAGYGLKFGIGFSLLTFNFSFGYSHFSFQGELESTFIVGMGVSVSLPWSRVEKWVTGGGF